jgi:hypothetical protein
MSLEITGKIIQKLELQSGVSAKGVEWKKQEFILETGEQYSRQVCIALWGEKINDIAGIPVNESITVGIELESREFNGRWYTSVRGWKIQRGMGAQSPAQPAGNGNPSTTPAASVTQPLANDYADAGEDLSDDLPF